MPDETTADELIRYSHILGLSCMAYLILSGASTFVPAVTMEAVSTSLGMSLAALSSLASAGSGLKAVITLFFMGPALDAFGPHRIIHWCLVGSGACNLGIAAAGSAFTYSAAFLINYVFNSLSEQPAFIVLFASYFDVRLGMACTSIACAYSLAGLVLPLVFGPLLVAYGWRLLWVILAACCLLIAPVACSVLRPGPIALHEAVRKRLTLKAAGSAIKMMNRLKMLASDKGEEGEGFTGGRLSNNRMSVILPPDALLETLGRDADGDDPASPVKAKPPPSIPFAEAIKTIKFWALMGAAFTFFVYGAELNLHLPSIIAKEGGKSAAEAAAIYSIYNGMAIAGKLLVGVVFSSPNLKRSRIVYVPAQLLFGLSHFVLFDMSLSTIAGGDLLGSITFATSTVRLQLFCALAGLSYGFVAALLHLLVREFFGLKDLARLQPIVFGGMIVGEMCGMAMPGILYDVYGTYAASMLVSLVASAMTVSCFLVMMWKHPLEAPEPKHDVSLL